MNPRPSFRIASSIVAFAMMGWIAVAPPATAQSPNVTIQVVRASEQVCVWGITSAEVRLDGVQVGTVSDTESCLGLNPGGADPPPIDLAPGRVVSVWEGGSKLDDLTIVDVGVTYLDPATMTATGWVQPNATVQVQFFEQAWTGPPDETQTITDAGDGLWAATATTLLSEPAQVSAVVFDADGDFSSADHEADDPSIMVMLDQDSIDMGGFPPNADGEFFVDGTSVMTFTFDENGRARFDPDQTNWFDFQTGQHMRVVGGSVEDDLVLAGPITSTVDADTDVISGTAPHNATVWLLIFDTSMQGDLTTQSDSEGAWSIDAMAAGYDLQEGAGGFVWVTDEDGDKTAQEWPTPVPLPPHIDLSYNFDPYGGWWSIEGDGFERFTEIQADIDGAQFLCPIGVPEGGIWSTDPYGNIECGDIGQPLEIGQTVTVRVAGDTDAVTVRRLSIDALTAGDTPAGTTEPNTEVTIWVDTGNDFFELTATSDGQGVWTSPNPTLGQGDQLSAWLPGQRYNRSIPNPRITVEPQAQSVSVEEFPVPAGNTGGAYAGQLRVTTPTGAECTKTIELSNGQSYLEMWTDDPGMMGPWCAIRPGDTVTVTTQGLSKSLVVQPLTISSVDTGADSVTGTASSDAEVRLAVETWDGSNGAEASAFADGSGSWTIAGLTGWDEEPWNLTRGDTIQAYWMDEDGDQTRSVFVWPSLSVNPDLDRVWGWGWPSGASITVHGVTRPVASLCSANEAYWYHYIEPVQGPYALRPCSGPATGYPAVFLDLRALGVDIVPGDLVTMSDTSGRTASVRVADIRVTSIDMANAIVAGTSNVPVQPNLLSALAMGWWELGPGDWEFRLTDHPYYPGPMRPEEFGVFRGQVPTDSGETVVRWYASPPAAFIGFTAPVDMGIVNVAKAGKAIDLTFRLTVGDQPVLDLLSAPLIVRAMSCPSGPTDQIETYGKRGSGLQNLGNGSYRFRWNVPKSMAKSCQAVQIDLGSYGTYPAAAAVFRFTK